MKNYTMNNLSITLMPLIIAFKVKPLSQIIRVTLKSITIQFLSNINKEVLNKNKKKKYHLENSKKKKKKKNYNFFYSFLLINKLDSSKKFFFLQYFYLPQ
jgi:hypothetical protein